MESVVSVHRYSAKNLLPDYLRGAAGLAIGGGGGGVVAGAAALARLLNGGGLAGLFPLVHQPPRRAWGGGDEIAGGLLSQGRGRRAFVAGACLERSQAPLLLAPPQPLGWLD